MKALIASIITALALGVSASARTTDEGVVAACAIPSTRSEPWHLTWRQSEGESCPSGGVALKWNVTGPVGPAGPQGIAGPAGKLSAATTAKVRGLLVSSAAAEAKLAKAKPGSKEAQRATATALKQNRLALDALTAELSQP